MGRVTKHRQTIGSQTYALEYGYNIAGQITSETYPSGKVVSTSYDAKGRLSGIADQSRTYLSGLAFQGTGGSMSAMNFGNGTSESFILNERFQMTNQTLSKGSEVLQKYDYSYGTTDLSTGNMTASKNNGQLAKIESYIGTSKQWSQRFGYDELGRLSESREYKAGSNSNLTYKQNFDFDRFGNMYRKETSNPTAGQENPLPYTPIESGDISRSNNRLATYTTYDDAGNVTTDNKFRTMTFAYDANGRMIKASKASIPDAISTYDASGLRVAEKVNDVWRFLIYDVGGKLVTEYGGLQSSDEGGVKYLFSDWQGSTRAVLSNTGTVNARSDYSAFGEEIQAGIGLRTVTQGFGSAKS
ncbi:MAG: RHS repeat protein [Chloracidobacterium sp.]|nr:RHS repeat protein [Chloracidobacterium sp.]